MKNIKKIQFILMASILASMASFVGNAMEKESSFTITE